MTKGHRLYIIYKLNLLRARLVMGVKISLAGDLGSGKSTVSAILIERLGAEYYSTGRVVREIADRLEMSIAELNCYMETHPEIDTEIDDGIRALSDDPRNLVIDSRMAWHFTRGTFKVYLTTDIETAATRIMLANRKGEHRESLEETVRETRERRESERRRYLAQYGVDITDLSNYSLVVDTTALSPEQIAELIISALEKRGGGDEPTVLYLSPERIMYPDDEPDMEAVMRYSAMLDGGEHPDCIEVAYSHGEFYLVSGAEAALAYAFSMADYVPARLACGMPSGNFVKMKNSL